MQIQTSSADIPSCNSVCSEGSEASFAPSKMLSRRCQESNDNIIPRLMSKVAVLSAGQNAIDLSTAENWLMRNDLIESVRADGYQSLSAAVGS